MLEKITTSESSIVTAVMLTNNRVERCMDCVRHTSDSVKNLPGGILVVNNGSQSLSLPESIDGVSCRVINTARNLGASARNLALSETSSKYILMLDDDAYIDEDSVAAMVRIFDSDTQIGAVAFRIKNGADEEACLLPTVFHGCACGFRADVLREIGGYPEGYTYYGEEYDVAFKLYQAGYRIVLNDDPSWVRHVRDSGGRNKDRIIKLVMLNNVRLWVSRFPWRYVFAAVSDTLRRYKLVARKERALRGFMLGLLGLLPVVLKGALCRSVMPVELFRKVILLDKVDNACQRLNEMGVSEVVICGTGKYPSIWLKMFKERGITVRAFLDENSCWENQEICGVPVWANVGEAWKTEGHVFITGFASLPENVRWKGRLKSEINASNGIIDLLNGHDVEVLKYAA